jgi:hypothetical protein
MNTFWHITVAAALVALVYISHWFLVFDTLIWAALREQAQHRYILETLPAGHGYTVEKRTFFDFGWLGKKQVWEVIQWTLGAAVVCLAWEIWG